MAGHDHCRVPLCTNRRDRCTNLSFHSFPHEESLGSRWLFAIRRDEGEHFKVSASAVVCSEHFLRSDYPPWTDLGEEEPERKRPREKRRLRPGVVPSVFPFKQKPVVRPSPNQRRRVADERLRRWSLAGSLPKFGPLTLEATYRKETEEFQVQMEKLNAEVNR